MPGFVGETTDSCLASRSQHFGAEDDASMSDENRNSEMQQQLEELRRTIASDIADQFSASEKRLRESLSKDLDVGFKASEQRLTEKLTRVIAEQLETAQDHLRGRMQVHAEELKDQVTKAAEGYGGTLDGIQRELKDFREEFRNHASDTKLILADHNSRISSLEQVPKR
jgi:phage-related minor tail protein